MVRVKQIVYKKDNKDFKELDTLCFLSKNLYNSTLYAVRQHFFNTGEYLNYYEVTKLFTDTNQPDYRALPAKVAKQTQMKLEANYKSFFSLLNMKLNGTYESKCRPPKYLDTKKGRFLVTYPKDALSFKREGYIKLSKTNIFIKSDLSKDVI